MEDGSVDFEDPAFVAQLIPPIDTMGPLPHKQDLQNPFFTVVVCPFLTEVSAGVEEYCLGRSLGAYYSGRATTWLSVVICEVSVRCQVFPGIFYTYYYLE